MLFVSCTILEFFNLGIFDFEYGQVFYSVARMSRAFVEYFNNDQPSEWPSGYAELQIERSGFEPWPDQ